MSRRGRTAAVISVLVVAAPGCAYFNGVYNAKEAASAADRLARSGQEGAAAGSYAVAAAKAETVLVRYPKSRWRPQALYLAGRAAAQTGDCERAEQRLTEYLAGSRVPAGDRERATVALASCFVRTGKVSAARDLLVPLTRSKEKDVAAPAALWAARAAVALGENDQALAYLGRLDAASGQWELASASLGARQYARAESLLAIRASRGDFREEVVPALRELWRVGRHDAVEQIIRRYDDARTSPTQKSALHLFAAELHMSADSDSLARVHLTAARRLSTNPAVDQEVSARLGLLSLKGRATIEEVQAAVSRAASAARGSPLQQRIEDNLLFVRMLDAKPDATGASLFLAAELARDSLRAPALAHTLFRKLEATQPTSLLAPKALLAAAALVPDSAEAYRTRVLNLHSRSAYALLIAGADISTDAVYRQTDELLRIAWNLGLAQFTDSIRRLRPPAAAPGTQLPPTTP